MSQTEKNSPLRKDGGKIQETKVSLGEYGFMSLVVDTESNVFGIFFDEMSIKQVTIEEKSWVPTLKYKLACGLILVQRQQLNSMQGLSRIPRWEKQ